MRRVPRGAWIVGVLMVAFALAGGSLAQEKGKAVQPVPTDKLGGFLKDLSNWKAEGPAEGQTMNSPQGTYSIAFRSYTQGEKGLEITLIDGAGVPEAYEDYKDLKAEVGGKGPNSAKASTVAGHPALEIFDSDSETATLMVLVKERFLVILDLDGATAKDDLKPLANQLDWKGLEGLLPK